MAGHNKWSKIKHTKAVVDAKRGRLWSKISKEITIAAKHGGSDTNTNARLRQAITSARDANMPNENIERAVKKGTGELAGDSLEEILYEAYAPGGIAILIEVVTDNRNRSAQDMRTLLSKNGGSLATTGSVAYQFQRVGEIRIPSSSASDENMLELALEAGASDVFTDDDDHIIITPLDQLTQISLQLKQQHKLPSRSTAPTYLPSTPVTIHDAALAHQIIQLLELLEDYDDTQNLYTNLEIAHELQPILTET